MNLLQRIFKKRQVVKEPTATDTESENIAEEIEEKESTFVELPRGAVMDVVSEEGEYLFSGRVSSYSSAGVSFEALKNSDGYDSIPIDTTVHVHGYLKNMRTIHFSAVIVESSRFICKVKNLEIIPYDEQRLDFRLPVDMVAHLYTAEDKKRAFTIGCKMVNISSTGACFVSRADLEDVSEIVLCVELLDGTGCTDFCACIRRKQPRAGEGWEYGVSFLGQSDKDLSNMAKTLFCIQAHVRKEQRDYEEDLY